MWSLYNHCVMLYPGDVCVCVCVRKCFVLFTFVLLFFVDGFCLFFDRCFSRRFFSTFWRPPRVASNTSGLCCKHSPECVEVILGILNSIVILMTALYCDIVFVFQMHRVSLISISTMIVTCPFKTYLRG